MTHTETRTAAELAAEIIDMAERADDPHDFILFAADSLIADPATHGEPLAVAAVVVLLLSHIGVL